MRRNHAGNGQVSFFEKADGISADLSQNRPIVLYPGETREFLPTIADQSVRLIITSPPYNVGKQYETKVAIGTYLKQQDYAPVSCDAESA